MKPRPTSTWPNALDTASGADLVHRASGSKSSNVSASLHFLSRTSAEGEGESTIVNLLEQAAEAHAYRRQDKRKLLAVGYLWQGDVESAVSLACDMLCHPAPAGFRSLLHLLLQFGQLRASAANGNREGPCPDSPHLSPLSGMLSSSKETAVLRLMGRGHSNKSIARELHVAPETVKCYAKKIFFKLSTHTRAEAVARASAMGIL